MVRAVLFGTVAVIALSSAPDARAEHPACTPPAVAADQIVAVRGVLEEDGRVARMLVGGRCMVTLLPDAADDREDPSASPLQEWHCAGGRVVMMKGRYHVVSSQTEWLEPINFSCN